MDKDMRHVLIQLDMDMEKLLRRMHGCIQELRKKAKLLEFSKIKVAATETAQQS